MKTIIIVINTTIKFNLYNLLDRGEKVLENMAWLS